MLKSSLKGNITSSVRDELGTWEKGNAGLQTGSAARPDLGTFHFSNLVCKQTGQAIFVCLFQI